MDRLRYDYNIYMDDIDVLVVLGMKKRVQSKIGSVFFPTSGLLLYSENSLDQLYNVSPTKGFSGMIIDQFPKFEFMQVLRSKPE